ncbi:MAG: ADOP family duplicated permease, partial [Bryobacteraceae bacterium]|nr:ADOP family duplicated permease [Bryobacteraceae bacterium]
MTFFAKPALRQLLRRPGFSLTVIATLALAIGANSTIFSFIDAVLLKPLPYPDGDRLVQLRERNVRQGRDGNALVAPIRLEDWNRTNQTLEGITGSYFENFTETSGALPLRVEGQRVAPRFFRVFSTAPLAGRTFTDAEEIAGGPNAVVISYGFWQERFGGDPRAIGQTLRLNGASIPVVGIMPASFRWPTASTQVWMPTRAPASLLAVREARFYEAVARLRPGVTPAQAQADLDRVQQQLGRDYPKSDEGWATYVSELKEEQVGGVRRSLWILFGAVAFVLLIACANIACLMLAQGARRERELSIRFGLGAERRQIIGQLFAEGLLLALLGALAGLPLAYGGTLALARLAGSEIPRAAEVTLDARILAFAVTLSLLTTVLFALAPAWRATRREVAEGLAHGSRGQVGSSSHAWQNTLIATQVTLAVVLLIGAGLLVRSFTAIQSNSLGMDPSRVLTFRLSASWGELPGAVAARHFRTLEALTAIPGVQAAALSPSVPAASAFPSSEIHIAGQPREPRRYSSFRTVTSGYFAALGIPIRGGQTCTMPPDERPDREILVNERFAREFFGSANPIGEQVAGERGAARIVGVVGDMREDGARSPAPAMAYVCGNLPFWPDPRHLVRVSGDPASYASVIRARLRELEPNRAVFAVTP